LCHIFVFYLLTNDVSVSRASDQMCKSWDYYHSSQPNTRAFQVEQSTNICLATHSWKQCVNYRRGSL